MLRWCSYCQKFLGEIPPYDDLIFTHGVCSNCRPRVKEFDDTAIERLECLVKIQKELWELGKAGDVKRAIRTLEHALNRGVRPVDFLLGFVGPLLHRAGLLWEQAEIDQLAQEQVHTFCNNLIEVARKRLEICIDPTSKPDVVFITVPENQHTLGMQLLELWLQGEGILAKSLVKGISAEGITDVYYTYWPKVLGFSIAMKEHIPEVRAAIQKLKVQVDFLPLILVGGHPIKTGIVQPEEIPEASLVQDELKLFLIIKTHLALGFLYDLKKKL
jgi:methanogenic corrinoid protein MtbC1